MGNKGGCTALLIWTFRNYTFYLGFTVLQDYFAHFGPSQSLGGAKTRDHREKKHDHLQAEFGLSHM